jgi:serine/threonine protein kinase, bacterial
VIAANSSSASSKSTKSTKRARTAAIGAGVASVALALSLAFGGRHDAQAAVGDVFTIAGSGATGATDGAGLYSSFNHPWGIVADGAGNAYVADTDSNKIRKIVLATGAVTTVAGSGQVGSADGSALSASFFYPAGIALLSPTKLAIADSYNSKIRVLDLTTQTVSTLAGSGAFGMADGTGAAATFGDPFDISFDGVDSLYVVDGGINPVSGQPDTNSVRKITVSTGAVTTVAGTGAYGHLNGPAASAQFRQPFGILLDGTNLYVADGENNQIRRIDITTNFVYDFAGTGVAGFADGDALTTAQFDSPYRMVKVGNELWVSDSDNHRIRAVDLTTNIVRTVSGSGTTGPASGPSATAQFFNPVGLALDPSGYLLVADVYNNGIRAVEAVNPLTTVLTAPTTSTTTTTTTATTATTTATTTITPPAPAAPEPLIIAVIAPPAIDSAPKVCESGTGTIQGDVIDDVDNNYTRGAAEKSLSGVKVTLRREDGLVCQSTETRSPYVFTNVAAGDYEVMISALAGRPETAATYRVSVGASQSATVTEHYIAPAGPTTTTKVVASAPAVSGSLQSATTVAPAFTLPSASVPSNQLALEAAPALEEVAFTGASSGLLAALSMCFAGAGAFLATIRRRRTNN